MAKHWDGFLSNCMARSGLEEMWHDWATVDVFMCIQHIQGVTMLLWDCQRTATIQIGLAL